MALEKAGVMDLQRRLTRLHTLGPWQMPMVHKGRVADDSIRPSPIKIDESHIHVAATILHVCTRQFEGKHSHTAVQQHSEQAAENV